MYQSFRRVLPPFPDASVVGHAPEVALFCAPRVSTHRPCVPRMCQAAVRTARRQWAPVPSALRKGVLRHPARRPSWLLEPDWAECIPRVDQTWRYDATRAAWRAQGAPSVRSGPPELVLAVCQWRARRRSEVAVGAARIFHTSQGLTIPDGGLVFFFECVNAIQRSPILKAWAPTRWMFRLAS